jgi:hypothetical protein
VQGKGQVQVKDGIAELDLVGICAKDLGHAIAVDTRDDKHALVGKDAGMLSGHLADSPSLQGVPQIGAIHHGRGLGHTRNLLDLPVGVGTVTNSEIGVHAAEADGVYLSIELGNQFARSLDVAIRSDPPDVYSLAKQLGSECIVATRGTEANADDFFRHERLLGVFSC